MLRLFPIVPLVLIAAGCAHSPESTVSASEKTVTCYFGESRMMLPDGRRVSKYQTLVRRVLMPEKSLIGEAIAASIPNRPKGIHLIGSVVDPDGTFRFKEKQSGATGVGKLQGPPWNWHTWTATTKLASNVVVESRVVLRDGLMKAEKSVLGPDGKLKFRITDRLSEIGLSECERRFERIKREASSDKQTRCRAACDKLKTCEAKLERDRQELNRVYCQDRCMKGSQSRAFRCVTAVEGAKCKALATCVRGTDID